MRKHEAKGTLIAAIFIHNINCKLLFCICSYKKNLSFVLLSKLGMLLICS